MRKLKRKKKRLLVKWRPVLGVALVVAVATGAWYSPISAIQKVRIEGAIPADRERLANLVRTVEGVPCLQVNPSEIEGKVLQLPEVRSADLARNPFGSALLRVEYRTPVARLSGSPDLVISDDGTLYQSLQEVPDLPQVQLPKGGPPTLVTVAGTWQPQRVATLAVRAREMRPNDVIRIQVESDGIVWLNLGAGRVNLGSFENLDQKVAVLKERLSAHPEELTEYAYLNLTDPNLPSLAPR